MSIEYCDSWMSVVISKGPSGETYFAFCPTVFALKQEVEAVKKTLTFESDSLNVIVAGTMSSSELLSSVNK